MNACFLDVIRWDEENNQLVIAYPEDCVCCLACELACPENCIDVVPNIPAPLRSSYLVILSHRKELFEMAKLEDVGEVISTDVLIVGGGVGGLAAAIKVKEANPKIDVLIVEKHTTGWAGKATKLVEFWLFSNRNNNADKFIDFQVNTSGFYLNDQELLSKYVQDSPKAIEWFADLGKSRRPLTASWLLLLPSAPEWSMTFIDIDMMVPMRARALKKGAKILNKIHVVELLKQGNRVVGAVGFDIVNGRFIIFKATATVLANGSCGYKVRRFWSAHGRRGCSRVQGRGRMRNAEYGNLYGHTVFQETDAGMVGLTFW